MRRGEFVEAERLADAAAGRAAEVQARSWQWRLMLLSAESAILRRDFAAAGPALAAQLPSVDEFAPLRARQKFLGAKLLVANGSLPAAREALVAGRSMAPPDSDVRLDIDELDGQVHMRLGQWNDAEALLNAVLLDRASDDYHKALALNDLGMGQFVRSRYDSALPYFERVAALPDLNGLSIYAASLSNAGMCYQRLGQFDRALAVQQRALQMHERSGKPEYRVKALGEMGNLYLLQDDPHDAQPYLRRAFEAATGARLLPEAAVSARNLAYAETLLGDWDAAEGHNDESKRLNRAVGEQMLVYNTLVAAEIAEGRQQFDVAARLYDDVLSDKDAKPSVRWSAHGGLAGVASKSGRPVLAAKHFEAALDIIEKTRSDLLKTDYQLSYLTQLISFYRGYVDLLVNQGQSIRALEIADSSRGRVLAERQRATPPPRANVGALRRLARATRTVFLSYWLTPRSSILWVITGDGIRGVPLGQAKDIDALVREYRSLVANVFVDPLLTKDSAGDKLYRLLIAPALPALGDGASVIIVPDGSLHGLNFETLPVDGPRRHYWIEDVQIQTAPSLASLTTARAGSKPGSALIIGNPKPHPPEFPALQYARHEMASVAEHFGADRVTSYEGERASPAVYRDARPERFSYVHFTAHATANLESPLDSAVILSGPDNAYKLYARDVAALPLAADLVTVSACRSAGERAYSGEGLVGFAWAFLRAGARRVVAGLWDVDDRSTADLMGLLYAGLADGEAPPAALRGAKLALIRRGGGSASPYAWGAFQLFTVVP